MVLHRVGEALQVSHHAVRQGAEEAALFGMLRVVQGRCIVLRVESAASAQAPVRQVRRLLSAAGSSLTKGLHPGHGVALNAKASSREHAHSCMLTAPQVQLG